ncbi:urease accessory protein UreE [Serratia aquatilis]|uniref:Urease accessory protein UreE n=1 Tax=Serratia aquatilis TaxID=1737515 RepID=A0ABV6ED20_9GAMM
MILIENIIGNIKTEPHWASKAAGFKHDVLVLEQWEAQKSRCRKKSEQGADIGLALDRHVRLSDGDVLLFDEEKQYLLTVTIHLRDVMVIHLDKFATAGFEAAIRHVFELGHALGNQHWKAVIKGSKVYVPLTVEVKMMNSVMKTHGYDAEEYQFVEGSTVLPLLTPSESRLLFGGAEDSHVHVHVHDDHSHSHHEHHHGKDHEHKH